MARSRVFAVWKYLLLVIVTALLYLFLTQFSRLLSAPMLKTQDLFFAMRHFCSEQLGGGPRGDITKKIFLVTVDDESIEKIERWPFRRRVHAELIQKLTAANPSLIAMDFLFAGKNEPLDDFMLAEAVQKSARVILASFVDDKKNHVLSLEEIRSGARGWGIVNKLQDKDSFIRRAHLFYQDENGKIVWPWEVEMLMELLKLDREEFLVEKKGIRFKGQEAAAQQQLVWGTGGGDLFIPFQEGRDNELAINFRVSLNDVEHLPMWKVLQEKDLSSLVRGKIVLVGPTSEILHDYYNTALGKMHGMVVNLNFFLNLLQKDFLRVFPLPLNVLIVVLGALFGFSLALHFDALKGLLMMTGWTLVLGIVFFCFFWFNFIGDFFTPFLSCWASFLGVAFYRYFHTLIENIRLKGQVITDPLTGIYNRRFLEGRLEDEFEKLASEKRTRKTDSFHELSVIMVDIDHFKKVNDTYGHQFGDDVIKTVSFALRESTRKEDAVARFGGEEFCLVLVHTKKEEALLIAEKIRKSVESKKFNYVNQVASFTISLGVASARTDNLLNARAIIRAADLALYQAKQTGRNRVCAYAENMEKIDSK